MAKSHLPLTALRAFEATARHLSFTRAANELHVTQGAVSQQIASLEERVGTPLFIRNGHRISLTQDGAALSSALGDAFDQIDSAVQAVSRKPGDRTLKLKVFPTIAIRWLIPRLSTFHAEHPGLDVQITTTLRTVDFRNEDVDLSIRYGQGDWPGMHSDLLFSEVLVPVCSPGFHEAHNLTSFCQLAEMTLLHSLQREEDWALWLQAAGLPGVKPKSNLRFSNSALAYQAALDGAGVAMAQLAFVTDHVREGRLIMPFPRPLSTQRSYFLVRNERRSDLARIAAFRRWIISQARAMEEELRTFAPSAVRASSVATRPE